MIECPASEPYIDAPVLAGATGLSHFDEAAARMRLDRLVGELPIRLPAVVRFSGGNSNDGWDLGETFLRVCWRADRDRMIREAMLVDALPADVPHAVVIGCGKADELSWVLSRRVPGRPLVEVAPGLSKLEIRRLFHDAACVLQSLHSWSFPRYIPLLVGERPHMDLGDALSVFASDLVLLPLPRILTQLKLARRLPHVDPHLIEAVEQMLVDLVDVDPLEDARGLRTVIHSDPSLGNWLVHEGRISALLDFEWTRIGPRDLELVTPLFASDSSNGARSGLAHMFLSCLAEDYPELFGRASLDRRLWLYELCFALRGVIWWPPSTTEEELPAHHPLRDLRRLAQAPLPHPF